MGMKRFLRQANIRNFDTFLHQAALSRVIKSRIWQTPSKDPVLFSVCSIAKSLKPNWFVANNQQVAKLRHLSGHNSLPTYIFFSLFPHAWLIRPASNYAPSKGLVREKSDRKLIAMYVKVLLAGDQIDKSAISNNKNFHNFAKCKWP